MSEQIAVAETDEDINATFALMKQLRPHLDEQTYLGKIKELQLEYSYNLIAIFESGEAKAAAGFRICNSLAWGKYLYVDDLITNEESRSREYANALGFRGP